MPRTPSDNRAVDILWHSLKALLCVIQFHILTDLADNYMEKLLDSMVENASLISLLPVLLADVILYVVIWRYYDNNDDRSYDKFRTASPEPVLLRDPAYLLGGLLTVVGVSPVFQGLVRLLLSYLAPRMYPSGTQALSWAIAIGGTTVATLLRIRGRNDIWSVQKNLPEREKRPGIIKRILYALIFFASLVLLLAALIEIVIPLGGSFMLAIVKLLRIPALVVAGLWIAWEVFTFIRHILDRRKFLRRLADLQSRGMLTYIPHGSPYLSLFSKRVFFGLTVTDVAHKNDGTFEETTYQVAVANCHRRRMGILLCENHVLRFMYSFHLRPRSLFAMMYAEGHSLSIPLGTFYINRTFVFPEGEGKRILALDPAPYGLFMQGRRDGDMIKLDNASELYGYTVYGKHAFLSVLERN